MPGDVVLLCPDCPLEGAPMPLLLLLGLWLDRSMPVLDAALDPIPDAFSELPLEALGLFTPLDDCPDFPGWLEDCPLCPEADEPCAAELCPACALDPYWLDCLED